MFYPLYIIFGLAPSIIWLLFYLRKDVHPEPKRKVLKVFLFGALATFPALFIERGSQVFFQSLQIPFANLLYIFIGVALCEETLKYLVVRQVILADPEFDEPVDSMLYMIISALGFAAFENIFLLSKSSLIFEAFIISVLRFLGATFLHALCSGVVGFFLAYSFFKTKNRGELLIIGLGISTLLHGFYNFSIIEIGTKEGFIVPIIILTGLALLGLALLVSRGFKKLKEIARE